jgi:NADH-ubiquinone oxidoreductase chain 5
LSDESLVMSIRILGLIFIAIVGGSILSWLMFSSNYFIILPYSLKNLTLLMCLLGGVFGYLLRNVSLLFLNKSLSFYLFSFISITMWFMPLISTSGLVNYPLFIGVYSIKSFDQGWSEFFGGQKIYFSIVYFSILSQILQNNNLKIYLMIFSFWVIFLVIFIFI